MEIYSKKTETQRPPAGCGGEFGGEKKPFEINNTKRGSSSPRLIVAGSVTLTVKWVRVKWAVGRMRTVRARAQQIFRTYIARARVTRHVFILFLKIVFAFPRLILIYINAAGTNGARK